MSNEGIEELKGLFESLVNACENMMRQYHETKRNKDSDESGGKIAFELSNICSIAREVLPSDPSNPHGIEAFEKEYDRIRSREFAGSENDS